jgi:hypothetical protein
MLEDREGAELGGAAGTPVLPGDRRIVRPLATVKLGGEAGNTKYDEGSGQIIVAIQTQNQLGIIDPRSNKLTQRVALAGCEHPHGLQVDTVRRLLFVACDANARLLTLDLRNRMEQIASARVGDRPDVLAPDSARHFL